ncbi:DUF1684 domain-containing protein [Fodinibius sediminis]|nr:DUF1684 domain-containing protein [Fodinibius sediminis]
MLLLAGDLVSCSSSEKKPPSRAEYRQRIEQWHARRAESLRQEDSWLSLAGLYKIAAGRHTIGADSSHDIVFPPEAARHIGTITRNDTVFTFRSGPETSVTWNGEKVTEKTLLTDNPGRPTVLAQDSFFWYVIERRGDYYLRLKNRNHPAFRFFNGIDHFPISRDWRVKARFQFFEEPRTLSIPDVLGNVYQDSLYGMLNFTLNGKPFRLAPLGNPRTDNQLFIILGDKTNGKTTYGGGRYLYIAPPDAEGSTYIDFNKAYNPPCVFTSFATCPLPPVRNRLPIPIQAGEKMVNLQN